MIFGGFHECLYQPEKTFGLRCRHEAGGVVLPKEARLQFTNPIPARDIRQMWLLIQVRLEPVVAVPGVVRETTSCWSPRRVRINMSCPVKRSARGLI